jgi:hypothetical protein
MHIFLRIFWNRTDNREIPAPSTPWRRARLSNQVLECLRIRTTSLDSAPSGHSPAPLGLSARRGSRRTVPMTPMGPQAAAPREQALVLLPTRALPSPRTAWMHHSLILLPNRCSSTAW